MATATKYLELAQSVNEAEALAAVEGLRLAHEIGVHRVVLEMDSSRIFKFFYFDLEDLSEIGDIILHAKQSLPTGLQASFKFTKRDRNVAAHLLAKRALLLHERSIWLEEWPVKLSGCPRKECLDVLL